MAWYWHVWDDAITAGKAKPVKPGDTIAEPDMEWPSPGQGGGPVPPLKPTTLARRIEQDVENLDAQVGGIETQFMNAHLP